MYDILVANDKTRQSSINILAMNTYERRQLLLELLRKQPGLRVPEIARATGVSEGTVRNDLNALEEDGRLTRMHGGAVLAEMSPQFGLSFGQRYIDNQDSKITIAKKVAGLVEDGASLLLDASSTVYHLASQLGNRNRLRIVTNGIDVARCLARNSTNTVVLMSGVVTPDGSSVTGSLSEQLIRDLACPDGVCLLQWFKPRARLNGCPFGGGGAQREGNRLGPRSIRPGRFVQVRQGGSHLICRFASNFPYIHRFWYK